MTDNNQLILPQPSALRPQGWEVEVEVISTDLTDEQRALVIQVKQLSAVVHMAGLERAKRFRLLRESFPKVPPGAKGDTSKDRPGWAEFLRREFDANVKHVNCEIRAVEAAGEKLDETGGPAPVHQVLQKIGSSHLSEIGLGATAEIRAEVWDKLLSGELPLTQRTIRAEVKRLNSDAGKTTLKVQAPKAPAAGVAPVLPTGSTPRADNRAMKLVSIAKHGSLVPRGEDGRPDPSKPPLREAELAYLRGNTSANVTMGDKLATALKTSRCGKVARIRALAEALHREFKSMGDRYHGAWDSDCDYPSYMHLWQHIWAEEEGYELHNELEAVRKDIAEANRFFGIALMHLYTEGLEVTE